MKVEGLVELDPAFVGRRGDGVGGPGAAAAAATAVTVAIAAGVPLEDDGAEGLEGLGGWPGLHLVDVDEVGEMDGCELAGLGTEAEDHGCGLSKEEGVAGGS